MAIGATIASKLRNDEFDVDVIVQIDCHRDVKPQEILDTLYESIRGEKGSRYYDCTVRNSRCVTVHYSDGMHIDFTPSVLLPELAERTSYIFHHKKEEPSYYQKSLIANPYGFADHFKTQANIDSVFAQLYETRAIQYEKLVLAEADAEDLPEHQPELKSMAVVALQLLKRWRNVQYDNRQERCPPSVMMAKFVADAAGNTNTLSEELLFQARHIYRQILDAHNSGELITVMNPACADHDCFTDRWPADRTQQRLFLDDLEKFIAKVDALCHKQLSLPEMQVIMVDLFGEKPTLDVFKYFNSDIGRSITSDASYTNTRAGSLDVAASGLLGTQAAQKAKSSPYIKKAKQNTFYGGEE